MLRHILKGSAYAALFISIFLLMSACSSGGSSDGAGSGISESNTGVNVRYTHVSMDEAQEMIESGVPGGDFILLDTRELNVFKHDHIPGAICIPEPEISAMSDSDTIAELPDKNQKIIVYCQFGGVSKIAAEKLCDMGYTNIYEFDGMDYWKGDIEYGSDYE